MRRAGQRILAAVWVLLFHLAVLSLVLLCSLFYGNFMRRECDARRTAEKLKISGEELHVVIGEMMGYVCGGKNEPGAAVTVQGQKVSFFNSREKEHLKDIRGMVALWKRLLAADLVILAAGAALAAKKRKLPLLCGSYLRSWIWLILTAAVAAVFALLRPTDFVNGFHRLLFRNNRWILNPATDRLIHLFPVQLFTDALLQVILILAVIHGLLCAGAAYFLIRKKKS